jgi:hypothetical protein
VCATITENTRPWGNCGGLAWKRTYRLNDKYICPKDEVEHPVVCTMNNSTALMGVVKGTHLGLKGSSIPYMENGSNP